MQEFFTITEDDFVSDSISKIMDNDISLRTSFSGESFPTEFKIGQFYHQIIPGSKGKVWQCIAENTATEEEAFVMVFDLDKTFVSLEDLNNHMQNQSNPHKVTASSVGAYTKEAVDDMLQQVAAKDLSNVNIDNYPKFKGATSTTDGESGILPAPTSEDSQKFLKGDGTYESIKTGFEGYPIGYRMSWDGDILPANYVEEKGQELNRGDYPELWQFAQNYGMVVSDTSWLNDRIYGKFSSGDGSTTFRMPDRRNAFERFSDTSIGSLGDEQLPNIKGEFTGIGNTTGFHNPQGIFKSKVNGYRNTAGSSGTSCSTTLEVDASSESSIYRDGGEVLPRHILTRSIRKAK